MTYVTYWLPQIGYDNIMILVRGQKSGRKKEKARIHIGGMTCTTCAAAIEKGLTKNPDVEEAKVNFASDRSEEINWLTCRPLWIIIPL